MRSLPLFVLLCLLAGMTPVSSAAEGTDNGLAVRLAPAETDDPVVGTAFQFRVELENRTKERLWVVGQVHVLFTLYYSSDAGTVLQGRGDTAPMVTSLVKLDPRSTASFTGSIVPPVSGRAELFLTIANRSELVREYRSPWPSPTRKVKHPGLWRGSVSVRLPLTVRPGHGLGTHQRDADLAKLRGGKMTPAEAVGKWTEWAASMPDERLVKALRARLAQPEVVAFERLACITYLVVSVHRGFGLHALPDLVAIAGNPAAPKAERMQALEAFRVARAERLQFHNKRGKRGLAFNLKVPDEVRSRAKSILDELSGGEDAELEAIVKRIRSVD